MLIAFSGLDGAGKSTQIRLLVASLRASGRRVAEFWSRGGYTPLFNGAKAILRRVRPSLPAAGHSSERSRRLSSPLVRRMWLHLAIVDLLFWYALWIRWKRLAGWVVVCDRYLIDTALDFERNFPEENVQHWFSWRLLERLTPRPSAGFILLVPVEESVRRSRRKGEPFPDSCETLEWRRSRYAGLAAAGREWQVLDGRVPEVDLHRAVVEALGACA